MENEANRLTDCEVWIFKELLEVFGTQWTRSLPIAWLSMSYTGRQYRLEEEHDQGDEGNEGEEYSDWVDGDDDDDDGDDNGGGIIRSDHIVSERRPLPTKSHQQQQQQPPPPSNEKLLCIAFVSFQCFAIVQMIAAWIAGSEAMIGDSFAMLVDAATYLLNWYAERQKGYYARTLRLTVDDHHDGHDDISRAAGPEIIPVPSHPTAALKFRKYTYQLELVTPLVTASTLVVVIVLVLRESIHVLILDAKRDESEQKDPNINLMLIFSVINLMLDILNVFCFAQASHGLGYKTNVVNDENVSGDMGHATSRESNDNTIYRDRDMDGCQVDEIVDNHAEEEECDDNFANSMLVPNMEDRNSSVGHAHPQHYHGKEDDSNLNMCSAYTHVLADTLRSLAVILAASLAEFLPVVSAEVADAAAAVVVSIVILLSLMPLVRGMVQTYFALQHVNDQLMKVTKDEKGYSDDDDDDDRHEVISLVEMQSPISNSSKDDDIHQPTKKANVAFV
jgi:Co/Zn/Cd efflux system component